MDNPDVDDYFQTEIPLTPEQDQSFVGVGRYLIWTLAAVVLLALIVALIR
jgi:hypothetical protein